MRLARQLLTLLVVAGCAAQRPPTPAPASPPARGSAAAPAPATESPAQEVERAARLAQQGQRQEADRILRSIIESAAFQTLDSGHQHQALLVDGNLAGQLHEWERAHSLIKRASETPEAGPYDWYQRLWIAGPADDRRDAAAALVVIAARWPQMLPQFEPPVRDYGELERALGELLESGSGADRYTVLRALQDTRFPQESGQASVWWRELALLQLERGERGAAVATLARVTNAYVVISIEADKRFDPIRRELRTELNVNRTAERAIAAALAEAQKDPASLKPMTRLSYLLRHSLRFEQALQVADTAIERVEAQGQDAYRDYEREYVWILNDRAYALFGLERWDAAVIQMETASRMSEQSGPNVSQTLNLALMYAELGRPTETLATLRRSGPASAYGDTVSQGSRLKAAVQLGDTIAASEALKFLSEHRHDSTSGYQEALLYADREEEGAKLLISRLADPRLRSDALLAVQQYGAENLPPQEALARRRWQALIARRDVQGAIRAVGYVKRYQLMSSHY